MKNVFIIGGASYNSVITLDEFPEAIPQTIHNCHFNETVGNTGAGKAMTLSQLNFKTTFHSLLGDDTFGKKVSSFLTHPNLNFITDIDPKGTERHLNLMNKIGERISIFTNPSSDSPEIKYSKFEPYLIESDFIVINIANYCRNLIDSCKKLNKKIWTDLHDYDGINEYHQDFIEAADYIFLSSDNLPDYKPFMEQQIANGKELVVCTHGKNGASAYTKDKVWIRTPIIENFKMINANGAGDAFFSGFSNNCSIEKCMKYGTISAGLCIESELIFNKKLNVKSIKEIYAFFY